MEGGRLIGGRLIGGRLIEVGVYLEILYWAVTGYFEL